MDNDETVLVATRITLSCKDPGQLFDAALAVATRDGITASAYSLARAKAQHPQSFDAETLLRHAVIGAGCGVRDFIVESVTTEPRRTAGDDLIHVERGGETG